MTGVPKASSTADGSWRRPLGHQVLFGIAGFLALLIGAFECEARTDRACLLARLAKIVEGSAAADWGTAEALAFGLALSAGGVVDSYSSPTS